MGEETAGEIHTAGGPMMSPGLAESKSWLIQLHGIRKDEIWHCRGTAAMALFLVAVTLFGWRCFGFRAELLTPIVMSVLLLHSWSSSRKMVRRTDAEIDREKMLIDVYELQSSA